MFFPILLVICACLLYSSAIWTEQLRGKLSKRVIALFICGFVCDMSGTACMFIRARSHHAPISLHGLSGDLALLIMLIHLMWALCSMKLSGRSAEYFNRFSVYAWCLWMVAFLTGIPVFSGRLWLIPIVVWCLFVYLNGFVQYQQKNLRLVTAPVDIFTRLVTEHAAHPWVMASLIIIWLVASPVISLIWSLVIGLCWMVIIIFTGKKQTECQ